MTNAPPSYRAGVATDPGMMRSVNEDRAHADEAAGIFLVVDGMGGHAAGERAAAVAVEFIPLRLAEGSGSLENRIREAITAANNEIFQLSQSHADCNGMACVLTVAVADGDKLSVGHVGDSRLYLAWSGGLRKLTSDHSPVGQREDRGDLTEAEAMQDPRRNEVFRDVGSRLHNPSDEDFIDIKTFPFRSDAAFLLCTDGLTDMLTSAEINEIVQCFDGNPHATAQDLVDAANQAGGKDNVTVLFIAGREFSGSGTRALAEARARHSVTRMRRAREAWKQSLHRLLWIFLGAVVGVAGTLAAERFLSHREPPVISVARHIFISGGDPESLRRALESAHAGDVIDAPKGQYAGPLMLREGVSVLSASPGETSIRGAVEAHNLKSARLVGFHIEGGLLLDNSSIETDEVTVSGGSGCPIKITGNSAGVLRASNIVGDGRCAISVEGESSPRIIADRISNGIIDVRPPARPILEGNNLVQPR